jgi:hypothetical protein
MRVGRFATFVGLAVPLQIDAQTAVPMKNIELHATLTPHTREVDATIRVAVSTPVGRIPVSGHGRLQYNCAGAFSGTMSYNPIVRFFARIKGVGLVTALDGHIVSEGPVDCSSSHVRTFIGSADVDSTLMKGWIKMAGDSVPFRGPAWTFGDTTYHSILTTRIKDRPLDLHINMYKHPRMMKAARK